ncbi:MAG: ATP-binding cassette domain-containing protein [Chloroflexi bacterium]|nr:ATP-binding cassette domain-containing protein [Chloroflexota bacterium]
MSDAPVISIENVTFAYRAGVPVLHEVNLTFAAGEFTAIIGNNGSGKTTLMKLVLGLLRPGEGQVTVGGIDTRGARVSDMARRIGFIFQDPNDQLFANTVEEEILFGLRNLGLSEAEIKQRVEETVALFGLGEIRAEFPRFLARGDKQKVCIAAIVAMRPQILLLDEPTTGQDHRDSRQIMELAQTLNGQGITVLLVTHDMPNVAQYSRRVVLMNDGRVMKVGPTAEIIADAGLMASCSLVPPQITRLSLALSKNGIRPAMSVDEMVTQAQAWLDGRGGN